MKQIVLPSIKINWSKVAEGSYFAFLIAIALLALVNLSSRIPNKTPVKILSVVSGSMTPTIPIGSAIFVRPALEYARDDIVTYRLNNNYITHRVFYAGKYYLTKGDANKDVDRAEVLKEQIIGKVVFSVPYVGYLQESTKSLWGLLVFVYLPTIIVLVAESRMIFAEIKKMKLKKIGWQSIAAIFFVTFTFTGVTFSYYSGKADAFSASLTAIIPSLSPSPSPTTSASPTPSVTPSVSPSASPTPSLTPSPTASAVPCPTSGANNCGNGAGSSNTAVIENNSTTIINQNNSSSQNTNVQVNQNTGGSSSSSVQISVSSTSNIISTTQ